MQMMILQRKNGRASASRGNRGRSYGKERLKDRKVPTARAAITALDGGNTQLAAYYVREIILERQLKRYQRAGKSTRGLRKTVAGEIGDREEYRLKHLAARGASRCGPASG
jgi:hypothetical protein